MSCLGRPCRSGPLSYPSGAYCGQTVSINTCNCGSGPSIGTCGSLVSTTGPLGCH
ncbi:MAG: hypothetical protein M5U28_36965 [Sandaracinaceae bacterium]|nr:hypothetical protein [Sandaracinaceae bacterium]